jgi:glycosyltransferase involved in cell wall biosynthesis
VNNPKISIITVCYNAQSTIERCFQSVINQDYPYIEYIVIDGLSTDSTILIAENYKKHIKALISEPDKGIYDAMNKGIALATGDIIGILNADDFLADDHIISDIAEAFVKSHADIIYGDLDYIKPDGNIVRKWVAGRYKRGIFNYGWMPPHPTFYCKNELFNKLGNYSLNYGTAADYELMLRFIHQNLLSIHYVEKVLVKMTVGGVSNRSIKNRINSLLFDIKAMNNNNILYPPITLILKPLRKLIQYF